MLTLAFAPISLFFWITAPDYDFFKLLNVAILTLTGTVGLSFLLNGMRRMNALNEPSAAPENAEAEQPQRIEQPINMSLLYLWVVLYGFVGTQLAWTLRPFFGDPGKPFEIFRSINSNFYINVVHSIMKALS